MVMAQGFSQEQVDNILADIDGSTLIDDKTKQLLHFSAKVNTGSNQIRESDIAGLKAAGCAQEEIFEAVSVASLFNYMDRMADALGAPVENFRQMVADMMRA